VASNREKGKTMAEAWINKLCSDYCFYRLLEKKAGDAKEAVKKQILEKMGERKVASNKNFSCSIHNERRVSTDLVFRRNPQLNREDYKIDVAKFTCVSLCDSSFWIPKELKLLEVGR
jgi:lipopolysaccharide biosynthesis regulator YciM